MAENPYQTPQGEITIPQSAYAKPTMQELLFSFDGRIPRRVYWGVGLILSAVFAIAVFGLMAINETLGMAAGIILIIPLIWISFAIAIKRWHDRDKSGWWILIGFVPVIGGLWVFIECGCLRGTVGDNSYGPILLRLTSGEWVRH